ncbi:hypothetical protein [Candidatus Azobacteroides pseudotrichonymphae]|uniref:hypothetical protein n=1 Tax=Candidatus Azobacteroides pseudotrichonymphae TaxID=511435 RepID=UPI0003186F49|nr:hypothetical protein [Candidatus Azobacteroides pseudotrichonymphae]
MRRPTDLLKKVLTNITAEEAKDKYISSILNDTHNDNQFKNSFYPREIERLRKL